MTSAGTSISIGMPVYNGEAFMHQSLSSLLHQTHTNFELIISDNSSTDRTAEICRDFAVRDQRIRYVRQPVHIDAGSNFAFVYEQSKSEYFMWAAADDVWHPEWLAHLLGLSCHRLCLAFGVVNAIGENGEPHWHPASHRDLTFDGSPFVRRLKYLLDPAILGKANPIYSVFRKNLVGHDDLSLLRSNRTGADMLFLFSLLRKAPIITTSKVWMSKRVHSNCSAAPSVAYKVWPGAMPFFVRVAKALNTHCKLLLGYFPLCGFWELCVYTGTLPFLFAINTFGAAIINQISRRLNQA